MAGINIGTNPTINYTYDAAGRITGIIDSNEVRPSLTAGATSYSVSGGSNQLLGRTGPTTQTYTYDAAGNLTADGTNTYTYDARGRLVQVTTGSVTTSYAINGLGQRVSKSSASATIIFVYDEAGHLLGEYDGTGNVIQETVWLGDLPVAVLKPGAQYYVNPDHLGSPRSIIDASGATVWKWDRDPFGNGAPTGTLTYNLRFPGQYFDVETGLYYNMARDYNPGLGRYIQSDPIGLRGGVNTYAYVMGDPMSRTDPWGLWFDSFRFCDCSGILENAEGLNNDSGYGLYGEKGPGIGQYKCNSYVDDALAGTGVAPLRYLGLAGPISAGTWADPSIDIPYFPVVQTPQLGDIDAIAHAYSDASGHVAVVEVPGESSLGAGRDGSHSTGWPWDESRPPQGTPVYRRCTCR
ncbi:MAG: hypothetical protein HQK59_03930 [Deltaproteobacteria bacterium]|nr:hypothetical protein [Deltaproteobacteria bacterium]